MKFNVMGNRNVVIGTVTVPDIADDQVISIGSLNESAEAHGMTHRTPGEHAMREEAVKAAKEKYGSFFCIGDAVSQ